MDIIINDFIKKSLAEDVGEGDITSIACIKKNTIGKAKLIVKEQCKIAGLKLAQQIYSYYDKTLDFTPLHKDGDKREVSILSDDERPFVQYGNIPLKTDKKND